MKSSSFLNDFSCFFDATIYTNRSDSSKQRFKFKIRFAHAKRKMTDPSSATGCHQYQPPLQCIFSQKKFKLPTHAPPKSMHGSLTIQKFRHTPALLTYILTKMPYHRHLNRAVRITCGLWYRWNELNHECGLHTECTQNFRSEQTELITFFKIQ